MSVSFRPAFEKWLASRHAQHDIAFATLQNLHDITVRLVLGPGEEGDFTITSKVSPEGFAIPIVPLTKPVELAKKSDYEYSMALTRSVFWFVAQEWNDAWPEMYRNGLENKPAYIYRACQAVRMGPGYVILDSDYPESLAYGWSIESPQVFGVLKLDAWDIRHAIYDVRPSEPHLPMTIETIFVKYARTEPHPLEDLAEFDGAGLILHYTEDGRPVAIGNRTILVGSPHGAAYEAYFDAKLYPYGAAQPRQFYERLASGHVIGVGAGEVHRIPFHGSVDLHMRLVAKRKDYIEWLCASGMEGEETDK